MARLSPTEIRYIEELKRQIFTSINTKITVEDFKQFFKAKKEKTASSFSGRHMGHYKVITQLLLKNRLEIVETLITLLNICIKTSTPLPRWQHCSQIMLEKGKGNQLEHLRIIQLCEADLNFMLNTLWGKRLIKQAQQHAVLQQQQFALPGLTCQSAIWNKISFCDLLRQTGSQGIMTDYDATVAFDWVLHSVTILTCQCLGMPKSASMLLYNLLHNMEFHVITGYGVSSESFSGNADPEQPCQGMLQGSSSAPPVYNIHSDVALSLYNKHATGATFRHPITTKAHSDSAVQFVDDKTEMINEEGINNQQEGNKIFAAAHRNSQLWSDILWTSGGSLNTSKCFYYYINPTIDYTKQTHKYETNSTQPGTVQIHNRATNESHTILCLEPQEARRTLGVILSPTGDAKEQITTTLQKIAQFSGKTSNCNWSQNLWWTAIKQY